jgi:hypothetical protein
MVDDSQLDPMDESLVPLAVAVGRLVLGAAALEKVLLVDIVMRLFHSNPLAEELAAELTDPAELARRVEKAIEGRNRVVHHLMEDASVAVALASGEGLHQVIADIDAIAVECQQVINELVVVAFPTLEKDLGKTLPELVEMVGTIDPETMTDPAVRQQIEFARAIRSAVDWERPQPVEQGPILGVDEENAVASACPEVVLSDDMEQRMRQIVASGTAPHAAFEIRAVEGESPTKGFYLLIAEPSRQRPHAVLVNDGLRYPRRDGTTTRWLGEAEVADLYLDRFRGERQQLDRLAQVADEVDASIERGGEESLDVEKLDPIPWVVVTLVPNASASARISFAGRADLEQWAGAEHTSHDLMSGFFNEAPPEVAVGLERYILRARGDAGRPLRYPCAYSYTDGAQAAAARLRLSTQHPAADPMLLATHLFWRTAAALRLTGRSAVRNAGAFGDAAVEAG